MREPLIEKPGRLEVDCHYDHSCSLTDRWIACPVHLLLDVEQVNVWDMDYQKIAEEYARKGGHDIVTHCASKNGYEYFRLNYRERPRYLGLPLVIKIDKNGKIQIVTERSIIFWAVNQSKDIER